MTGPDRRALAQLAYEDYVRKAGVGGRVLGWDSVEPRTRAYWRQRTIQAVNQKARELFAASHKFAMWETFDDAWATLGPAELRQYRVRAREALKTELIVAAQNEEAYTWAKNH